MTKTLTIAGIAFDVSTPYAEGHTCTEAEAKALNQTRGENIRNNQAKAVKAVIEAAGGMQGENGKDLPEIGTDAMAELTANVADYDKGYVFTLASVGGGRKSKDPVEVEANKIARAAIMAHLKASGRGVKDVDKDLLAAKIAEVAGSDNVVKAAKKAVAERTKLAEGALADLDI